MTEALKAQENPALYLLCYFTQEYGSDADRVFLADLLARTAAWTINVHVADQLRRACHDLRAEPEWRARQALP